MDSRTVVTRIAPSPTGDPHVGTAYIGLFNYLVARQNGGRFILRVEDTDRSRYVESAEGRIYQMMHWLGLSPDESPEVGGPQAPYRQSERQAANIYQRYAEQLLASGHAYRAFETPEELEALRGGQQGKIAIPSRQLSAEASQALADRGQPFTIRLKVPLDGDTVVHDGLRNAITIANSEIPDQVLLKTDGFPTYHLANVVDDHLMQVTHVIRAEEWIVSTPIHVLLYQAFGWQIPAWYHMPLLRNDDRSKISKRKNHTSIEWYRDQGFLPEAMLNFLATMGWTHPEGKEVFSLDELLAVFDINTITLGGPVFNLQRLKWLNGKYLREVLSPEIAAQRLHLYLQEHGQDVALDGYFYQVAHMLMPRIEVFSEFWEKSLYFWGDDYPISEKAAQNIQQGQDVLRALLPELEALSDFSPASTSACFKAFAEAQGLKLGKIMPAVRSAVSGTMESPDLGEMLQALGRDIVLKRIQAALVSA